ncbi:MAG: hypothetical protein ACK5O7_04205 [Holosporales bacterium]
MLKFHPLSRYLVRERGAVTAEFVLILPVLVVLIFGFVEAMGLCWLSLKGQRMVSAVAAIEAQYDLDAKETSDILGDAQSGIHPFSTRPLKLHVVRLEPSGNPGSRWKNGWASALPQGEKMPEAVMGQFIQNPLQSPVVVVYASYDYKGLIFNSDFEFFQMSWVAFAAPNKKQG